MAATKASGSAATGASGTSSAARVTKPSIRASAAVASARESSENSIAER